VHAGFWLVDLRKKDHLKDLGVEGRIIFKWKRRRGVGCTNSINPAQDWDRWQAIVNAVMKLRGSLKCGEFFE
jgi:hypothetical protein